MMINPDKDMFMTIGLSRAGSLFPEGPRAKVVPHHLEQHGHVRVDEYYWLNDRTNPEVLAYLQAENDYATTLSQHTTQLEETLFDEIKGRIKQTDLSVPYKLGDTCITFAMKKERSMPCIVGKRDR